jgi:hypothetical protein
MATLKTSSLLQFNDCRSIVDIFLNQVRIQATWKQEYKRFHLIQLLVEAQSDDDEVEVKKVLSFKLETFQEVFAVALAQLRLQGEIERDKLTESAIVKIELDDANGNKNFRFYVRAQKRKFLINFEDPANEISLDIVCESFYDMLNLVEGFVSVM